VNIGNFESNRIVTSVFGWIRNEHNYSKYTGSSREWCLSENVCVYSAVVNNGPGPVSPWSLYIGPLWPIKYWNSYNRNHNSVLP